jgi:ammonia channel protein AmtB
VWPHSSPPSSSGRAPASSRNPIPPHNLTFVFIGAGLLWVGWFGFNAGSNLEANGLTAQAFLNTIICPGRRGPGLGSG